MQKLIREYSKEDIIQIGIYINNEEKVESAANKYMSACLSLWDIALDRRSRLHWQRCWKHNKPSNSQEEYPISDFFPNLKDS